MTTLELKKSVINRINKTTNKDVLFDISRLLEMDSQDNSIYNLSENEVIAINEGIDQIESGEFVTNDQAKTDISKWLSK